MSGGVERTIAVAVLLGLVVSIVPLWLHDHLPLHDFPNHLARTHLESLALQGEALPAGYEIEYAILPNLAVDLILPPLIAIFDVRTAARIFLSLAVLLYWLGPAAFVLQNAASRRSGLLAALVLLPLALSPQLFWGFLNFYFGFGLAFLALAHLQRLRRKGRFGILPLLVQAAFLVAVFFCHLSAWGIYGLVFGVQLLGERIGRARRAPADDRRPIPIVWGLAHVVPSVILCVLYLTATQSGGDTPIAWGTVMRKLQCVAGAFRGYDAVADVLVGLIWAGAIVVGFAATRKALATAGSILAAIVLLGLVFIVLPYQLGSTTDADVRLVPAVLVIFAALLGRLPVRRIGVVVVLLLAAVLLRVGTVEHAWSRLGARLDGHAQAFALFEPGDRILPIIVPERSKEVPERYFACWALMSRGAYLPDLFAFLDQQPLRYRHGSETDACLEFWSTYAIGKPLDLRSPDIPAGCDYVWLYNPDGVDVPVPATFEVVHAGRGLTVYATSATPGR